MSAGGAVPAGSGRSARLDPFALPVRYRASDERADRHERLIELGRERVVVQRAVGGVPMKVSARVSDYLGIAIRIVSPRDGGDGAVAVVLEHRDPGLSVPLHVATDGGEIAVECNAWVRVLGLPLLVPGPDGALYDPRGPLGALAARGAVARRRGRALKCRRSPRRLRRKPAALADDAIVHRDEREIIARN